MGAVFFFMFAPIILAFIGVFIALLFFLSICLLTIGASGVAMNKIYAQQYLARRIVVGKFYNVSAICLGVALPLIPFGYLLFNILKTAIN